MTGDERGAGDRDGEVELSAADVRRLGEKLDAHLAPHLEPPERALLNALLDWPAARPADRRSDRTAEDGGRRGGPPAVALRSSAAELDLGAVLAASFAAGNDVAVLVRKIDVPGQRDRG